VFHKKNETINVRENHRDNHEWTIGDTGNIGHTIQKRTLQYMSNADLYELVLTFHLISRSAMVPRGKVEVFTAKTNDGHNDLVNR